MKKLLLILLLPTFLFAQEAQKTNKKRRGKPQTTFKGNISGKVFDKANNKQLEFATVSLSDPKTKKIIEGTITDAKGRFNFKNISVGDYKITVSFIGYTAIDKPITTSKKNPDLRLNIELSVNSELLSEIKIEEEKAIYETRIDKIVYNAEHDLNDSENDATDVLRKAPLLSVDLDGNVSLRGSQNIKFLVNGKASTFFSSDVATALQMIPADQIKNVEVITSPGAKYDGEGDAGIVNIITKKTIIDGYKATFNGALGTRVNRLSANLNVGKGRFGLSARGGSHFSWPRKGTTSYSRKNWNESGDTSYLYQEGKSFSQWIGYRGNISAFYDINAYNTINSSLSFGGRKTPTTDTTSTTHISNNDSTLYNTFLDKTQNSLNVEWTTDYTKTFANNKDRKLSLAVQIGGDINDGNTEITELSNTIYNQNDEKVIEQTLQADYTHPFGEHKVELGTKFINRDREIVYSNQENTNYLLAETFNYRQEVLASYFSSEINLAHGIGLKSGIRYELTSTNGEWKSGNTEAFNNSYASILPNVTLSKSFSPMRSIKLSYNQRITRPSVGHINPNENKIDNRNFTVGNPNLTPTITEQYELTMNSFGKTVQGSYQLYYKHSTAIIESFLEVSSDTSISTYKNIGESQSFGGSYFGSIRLNKFSLRGSFNLYSYTAKDPSFNNNEWTTPVLLYTYHIGGNYDLGKNWKAEAFGFFRSPTQSIQGTVTNFSMMSIGVKKSFKNKRGSLGLRIVEPFKENKEFTTNLEGENFIQSSVRSISFRSFGISFKYTFGKLNFNSSSKNSSIKNDDIKQEGGGEF